MKKRILGRSESVRTPAGCYGGTEWIPRCSYRTNSPGPASDYASEDGLVRHPHNGIGSGIGVNPHKRVSFNRDVAVKRIPSLLRTNNRNSTTSSTSPVQINGGHVTSPAAIVVVFPTGNNNNSSVSQIFSGRGRGAPDVSRGLAPEQQQRLLREARAVLDQLDAVSCHVSRDEEAPPPLTVSRESYWRRDYGGGASSSPSPPPSPVVVHRRRVAHPPPVRGRPLRRSESLAGIAGAPRGQWGESPAPRRLLKSSSNTSLHANCPSAPTTPSSAPTPPRVIVRKKSPSVRTPLFQQKSNNSLGESSGSGSGSSGEAPQPSSGFTRTQTKGGGIFGGILPPAKWPSFSSTPSPISSLSSASSGSSGRPLRPYFFGQEPLVVHRAEPSVHSDSNENVVFRHPQGLRIFQSHHQRGIALAIQSNTITNTTNTQTPTPIPPPPPPLPPKEGGDGRIKNVTTLIINGGCSPTCSSSSSPSIASSECGGVSLAGEEADDDEEEDQTLKFPLILRATSTIDIDSPSQHHNMTAAVPPRKPFFYGDRLARNGPKARAPPPPLPSQPQQCVPNLVKKNSLFSTLLRRKSSKIIATPPGRVLQLGTEERARLQQQKARQNEEILSTPVTKRPTGVKSFFAWAFLGRGRGRDGKKALSISTPQINRGWEQEQGSEEGKGVEYREYYHSNKHYY